MARFLFVVPPLAGHVNPTISVGRQLARRGHDVAWTGPSGATERLLPHDVTFLPAGDASLAEAAVRLRERAQGLRNAAALKFLWEDVLIPLGYAMADDIEALVDGWLPDVLVVDQQALAGAAVARKRGLSWATSATTTAELVDPLAAIPHAERWVQERLAAFQVDVGVPDDAAAGGDLRFSEHLVVVFSSRQLVGGNRAFPPHYAFVGPAINERPDPEPFPWSWLDPGLPHVLVSLGTLNAEAGERFFCATADALADEPLQTVLVAPPALLGWRASIDNLLVRPRVPQLELLPHLAAVVSHGGHNTVCETLAHGLPMVLAPIHDDQPIIADQVVQAGAGVRVRFGRARPIDLRLAVRTVLDEPSFGQAASVIRRSFESAGGAPAAANRLEMLAFAPGERIADRMTGVALLEASGLTKRFGSVQALSGLDLSVDGGQVVAVLGPNGAGKTTFVRMVATLVRPDSGTLRVAGIDVLRHPRDVRKIIGLAGQFAAVEEALTGRENLELIGRLFGHDRPTARRNATVVLELMGLYDAGERLVRTYSGGMRRRVDLGASLVGAPKLLLLDEPTTGLDPRSRIELWDAIRALVQSGTDVLLTTQYLDEADQLASQIVIIDHGAVIAQGSPAELKGRAGRDVIEVHARAAADLPHVTRALQSIAVDPPRVDVGTRRVTLAVDRGRAVLADVVRALDGLELPIDDIALRRPTLDEVFLALTRPPDDTNDDTKEVAHVDHDEPVAATTVG